MTVTAKVTVVVALKVTVTTKDNDVKVTDVTLTAKVK